MHSKIDITQIDENDPDVWEMIGEGRVKGCFQIEGHLGKTWAKALCPNNIEELAALISVIRPGVLKAKENGKSMTQHYADRKNGSEEVTYLHPALEPVLNSTFGVLCYQEQAMTISQIIAGFNLKEADDLRKAIGKKKADLMKEIRSKFIAGAKQQGVVSEDIAENIFDWIEKSARYSFNKCLDPTTIVETENGYKMLLDIQVGDKVLGPTDDGDRFINVVDVIDSGTKELYEIELESGEKISCTLDHKFLCSDKKTHTLLDIIEKYLEIMVRARKTMRASKIVSIKKIGMKPTMDIEVDSDQHLFYGNNIATSNSHAVAYAKMAYWSAYLKCHYVDKFIKHWLISAEDKIDPDLEKRQLILAAKAEGLKIKGPHFSVLEENFTFGERDGTFPVIYFGICNVKNVGSKNLLELKEGFDKIKDEPKNWTNILVHVIINSNKRAVENLISVGAFSGLGKSRTEMLHEYKCFKELTKKEIECIQENLNIDGLQVIDVMKKLLSYGLKKDGGFIATHTRSRKIEDIIMRLKNPGRSLQDNSMNYAEIEEKLLGYSINHSELDACSDACHANATCKQISEGRSDNCIIAVVVKAYREYKTKNGDMMAFLSVEDDSGELENIVIFPDIYEQNKDIIYDRSTLLLSGQIKDKKKNSFIVDKVFGI